MIQFNDAEKIYLIEMNYETIRNVVKYVSLEFQ